MESPCHTPPAPGNRRVVRTGCMLADDVIFRCRGRVAGRFHAGAKRQQRVESEGWERWQIWIGTKSRLLKLKTQRFGLDRKTPKLLRVLCSSFEPGVLVSNVGRQRAGGSAGRGGVPAVPVRRPYRGPGDTEYQRVSHFCGVDRGARRL